MKNTPYIEITDPTGRTVERMEAGCERYARSTEFKMLENGYTIRVNGRKLTKKELWEETKKTSPPKQGE